VVALTGDVSFGFNGMELEPATRQGINIITVVSNNAGIGARAPEQREQNYGQYMGFRDYQKIAEAFGGYGERVEKPEDIRPALERARASGLPAIINVIVESDVKVVTQAWSAYKPGSMGVKRD
jgi:acetolactate synthase-1/2/3 large subunit